MKKAVIKPRINILCNGELAEPRYFQDFKDSLKSHNILVKYNKKFLRKAPWGFIEAAIKYKEEEVQKGRFSLEDGDQIWLVFDVDNYWNENEKKFKSALQLAKKHDLKIAYSNECFEFWFLCHFDLYNASIPRTDYHKKLAKHFKDESLGVYKKNMKGMFKSLTPFQKTAIRHAKKLYKKGEVQNNPSTGVHVLIEELLGIS